MTRNNPQRNKYRAIENPNELKFGKKDVTE